jgi:hypothetical protein
MDTVKQLMSLDFVKEMFSKEWSFVRRISE